MTSVQHEELTLAWAQLRLSYVLGGTDKVHMALSPATRLNNKQVCLKSLDPIPTRFAQPLFLLRAALLLASSPGPAFS